MVKKNQEVQKLVVMLLRNMRKKINQQLILQKQNLNQKKIKMRKYIIFIITLFIHFVVFSQNYEIQKIQEIQTKINNLEEEKKKYFGQQADAINSQILALEQEKTNLINAIKAKKGTIEQQNNDNQNIQKDISYQTQQAQNQIQQIKIQQENSRQSFFNDMNNSLNSFASSIQNAAMIQVYNNLKARQNTIDNFARENQQKLDKIITIYNSIPKNNFNKVLNGVYKAYFISNKKYCYAPDYELSYVEDCYVNVKSNIITNIYMFGNKELESNLPSENPENSILNNGFVKYINLDNLETYYIVIIEPFLKNVDSNSSLKENNVGYITLWSSNKEDEGKIVYVQELFDNYTKLNREIAVKIQYAKNEKEIKANTNASKTPFNLNYTIFYLGEVTNTPFGRIALATKISNPKENNRELTPNEHRYVQIKKYRE